MSGAPDGTGLHARGPWQLIYDKRGMTWAGTAIPPSSGDFFAPRRTLGGFQAFAKAIEVRIGPYSYSGGATGITLTLWTKEQVSTPYAMTRIDHVVHWSPTATLNGNGQKFSLGLGAGMVQDSAGGVTVGAWPNCDLIAIGVGVLGGTVDDFLLEARLIA